MSSPALVPDTPARVALRRPTEGRMIAGVASGLAEHLRMPVGVVRTTFVVLSFLSGAGLLAYGVLWVLVPRQREQEESAGLEAASRRGMRTVERTVGRADDGVLIASGMLVLGLLWLVVTGGAVPAGIFWPLVIGGVGVVTIWVQVDERVTPDRTRKAGPWQRFTRGGGAMSIVRLLGGLALVVAGVSWILATQVGFAELPGVLGASGVLIAGLLIVLAPWLHQQRSRIRRADADRLRAEARADMAAHLHDSVLQTLALIQRQAGDPTTVAALARRQERELRTWLYGDVSRAESLRAALQEIVTDIESRFAVDVELVCVGDTPVDDSIEALGQAVREAVTNAAKHSGAPRIDVYAEVEDGRVEVFVRDRGKGFDPDDVPEGRMGVRESIRARMDRYGGTATIRSEPGNGTEVRLEIGG